MDTEIRVGEIYNLYQNNQTIKVIGINELEILYDYYWEHNNSWAFSSNLNKKGFFYRMNVNNFLEKTRKIGFQELSNLEFDVIRPDLPMELGRIKNISWDSNIFKSKKDLDKYINESQEINLRKTIDTNKIWLYPVSPNNRFKKGELIESNEENLTILEILFNANKIRNNINLNKSNGIGIYRLGINKKTPSYYIGEYINMTGNG